MLRSKHIDKICCVVLALTLVFTCGFMGAAASGMIDGERLMDYENRLFDQSRVHTLELVMEDWDSFLAICANEEYAVCNLVIDGEAYKNVAIRAKGNTSLSSVASYGNNRYSFKIEFDHYENGKSYHGLDKLSLNNLIQDTTHMKDYIAYTLMNKMGVASPLCSFVEVKVNGEYWGLYLAVEGVEESFLARNYGSDYGDLYKPDSLSFGGGRGNGKDFDMGDFQEKFTRQQDESENTAQNMNIPQMPGGMDFGNFSFPGGMEMPDMSGFSFDGGDFSFDKSGMDFPAAMPEGMEMPDMGGFSFGGGGFSMGGSDVMLQYTDDDPDSYANIFDSAKTDVTDTDQQRLIQALKKLTEGDASAADQEQVIRYLAVHHFLCNDDSYTGTMIHNYYLYEENGVLSMIPWDYNLAFGSFSMGGSSGATSAVNRGIDSPVSSGDVSSRPILSWIFASEEKLNRYHEIYREFLETYLESGWLEEEIARVSQMIAPYVEKDPTSFYTYEEFTTGVETMREFCALRTQSIRGQLDGVIPTTSAAQRQSSALIDASHLNLSAMGSMGGMGFGGGGNRPGGRSDRASKSSPAAVEATLAPTIQVTEMPAETPAAQSGWNIPGMGVMPSTGGFPGGDMSSMPDMGGMTMPEGMSFPDGMNMPEGMTMPQGMNFPEGMQFPGNMGAMGTPPQGMPGMNGTAAAETSAPTQTPAIVETPSPVPAETETMPEEEKIPPQMAGNGSSERPNSRNNAFDFQDFSRNWSAAPAQSSNSSSWILLGASVLVLILGLVIAKFSKGNY